MNFLSCKIHILADAACTIAVVLCAKIQMRGSSQARERKLCTLIRLREVGLITRAKTIMAVAGGTTATTYELQKYRTRINALQISSAWEGKFAMRIYLKKKICNAWKQYEYDTFAQDTTGTTTTGGTTIGVETYAVQKYRTRSNCYRAWQISLFLEK